MRFFIDLSYCGTRFNGWQNQKNQHNSRCVQEVVEIALSTLTHQNHEVVGCGRTDSGVHANHYIAHVDSEHTLDESKFIQKLNQFLPEDVAIHSISPVASTAHARFDAVSRQYSYYMHLDKNPFPSLSFQYKYGELDLEKLQAAANVLLRYQDFNTFCKTKTDVKTTLCHIMAIEWRQISPKHFRFQITADRFLRGMVRLIVGMCLDVARGRLTIEQVHQCLENQQRLPRHWSVPAIGLFLEDIQYPSHVYLRKDQGEL